jgi:hypothetical protein
MQRFSKSRNLSKRLKSSTVFKRIWASTTQVREWSPRKLRSMHLPKSKTRRELFSINRRLRHNSIQAFKMRINFKSLKKCGAQSNSTTCLSTWALQIRRETASYSIKTRSFTRLRISKKTSKPSTRTLHKWLTERLSSSHGIIRTAASKLYTEERNWHKCQARRFRP